MNTLQTLAAAAALCGGLALQSQALAQPPGSPNWEPASMGAVPPDGIVYGQESNGAKLYICRAHYNNPNEWHPGKTAPHLQACNFGYGGAERRALSGYQVAVSDWQASSNGNIPSGALVASYENGQPRFFCRAAYGGGVHPGKLGPGFGGCNIGYGGHEITVPLYQVLTRGDNFPYRLSLPYSNGNVPYDAIVGGFEGNEKFYLCVAEHAGSLHPGKVRAGLHACNISYGGQEYAKNSYRVLEPGAVPHNRPGGWVFPAGNENGHALFSCHADYAGGVHPGKTWIGYNACNIGYGGAEVPLNQYQVLDHPFVRW